MHRGPETLCRRRRFDWVDVEEDRRELIATHSRDHVPSSKHQCERRADGSKHRVARLVPELVIDALQMIDVDREDREWLPGNRPDDAVELAAILEPGEPVGRRELGHPECLEAQFVLDADAGREVAELGADVGDRLDDARLGGRKGLEEVGEHTDDLELHEDRARDEGAQPQRRRCGGLYRIGLLREIGDDDRTARRTYPRDHARPRIRRHAVPGGIEQIERRAREAKARQQARTCRREARRRTPRRTSRRSHSW